MILSSFEAAALGAAGRACPLPMAVIDGSRRVHVWNGAAEALLGARVERLDGRHGGSELEAALDRALDGALVRDVEIAWRRADGEELPVRLSAAPLEVDSGEIEGAVLCVLPVLDAAGSVADAVAVRQITHEFNNVLTVISGYSATLLRRIADDDPLRRPAEQIAVAAGRGASLARRLAAVAHRSRRPDV